MLGPMPRGPRVVLTVAATTFAANILLRCASFPVDLCVPSFRITTGILCEDISIHLMTNYLLREVKRSYVKVTRGKNYSLKSRRLRVGVFVGAEVDG